MAELKKDTGAQMVASAGDKPLLEGGYYPGQEDTEALKFPPVKVDRVVGQGDKITIPDLVGKGQAKRDLTLTAHMTPGHSPGCTTWTTVAREKKWNHTVVFFCSATVALNRLVGKPTYPGIVEDYKKTFQAAQGIIADVFLAPHPEMFKMEDKRPLIGKYPTSIPSSRPANSTPTCATPRRPSTRGWRSRRPRPRGIERTSLRGSATTARRSTSQARVGSRKRSGEA